MPYVGWVVGVSTAGQIKAMWASGPARAGIWQAGGGLVSDGSGQILLSTGNGFAPGAPAPGTSPPSTLGESVVRLAVQQNGTLAATDFFSPYDALNLDNWDGDLGSGAPVALPSQFGTASFPHLMTITGKEGYVYVLDRDHLGGIGQGPSGGDAVVNRIGPYGGVWSRPTVWPGDGGYVYEPTASPAGDTTASASGGVLRAYKYGVDGTGKPTLALAGTSTDAWGFGSGAPVVTSDGTTSGSAILWAVWDSGGSGANAQLRAYSPVPVNAHPQLLWSAPIGTASKFASPGVASGRLYVGTRDSHVLGFGAPVAASFSGSAVAFPTTTVGQSSNQNATFTANETVTVNSVSVSGAQFSSGTPSPATGTSMSQGQTLTVPVSFHPSSSGPASGTLTLHTTDGDVSVGLSGTGQANGAELTVTPPSVSFGGTSVGGQLSSVVTFANTGSGPLTINTFTPPGTPFSTSGAPAAGSTLAAGHSIDVTVNFQPASTGNYSSSLEIDTTAGNATVNMSGTATTPSHLVVTPASIDYGAVADGSSATAAFTLTNTGGATVTITKSKPPVTGPFAATTTLDEGTAIPGGGSVTETVRFIPPSEGPVNDAWLITGNDGTGQHTISFIGAGVTPPRSGQSQQSPGPGPAALLPGVGPVLSAAGVPVIGSLRVGSKRIVFSLSHAARIRFAIERKVRMARCLGRLGCSAYVQAGRAWTVSAGTGRHSIAFRGRPRTRGAYRLSATPVGMSGPAGATRRASFSVG
jgi:iron transport multicopper oxidase